MIKGTSPALLTLIIASTAAAISLGHPNHQPARRGTPHLQTCGVTSKVATQAPALPDVTQAFVENRGQWDGQAQFVARTPGMNIWVTGEGAVLDYYKIVPDAHQKPNRYGFPKGKIVGNVVRMSFVGAQPTQSAGTGLLKGSLNYLIGSDKTKWTRGVHRFSEAQTSEAYKGIKVRYYLDHGTPRYDLVVKPGADPSKVGIRFEGAEGMHVLPNGNLQVKTSVGTIEEGGLYAYQEKGASRVQVPCRMVAHGNTVKFSTGDYDNSYALVIDPLISSTYLGGSTYQYATGVAVDASGNAIVVGNTQSSDFPVTTGAYSTTLPGLEDAFISKISPDGTTLIFGTYLGGGYADDVFAVDLDANGNIVLGGSSESSSFPVTAGAYQSTKPTGYCCGWAGKLSSNGSTLLASTFLGGNSYEYVDAIAVDQSGNIVVAGSTQSTNFPVSHGAYQSTAATTSSQVGFVSRISPDCKTLISSTLLGGSNFDTLNSMCIDNSNNAIVVGVSQSTNFPASSGAFQNQNSGASYTSGSPFVSRISADGTTLVSSTFLSGSSGQDTALGVAVDSNNNAVVVGQTYSSDFPVSAGAFQTSINSAEPAFISRISADGTTLVSSTFLGGSISDSAGAVAVDAQGNAVVAGYSYSPDFPTTPGAFQGGLASNGGQHNAFVVKMSADATTLINGTLIGGTGQSGDLASAIALDSSGNAVIVGSTDSPDYPTTGGAYITTLPGGLAAFVSKLSLPQFSIVVTFSSNVVVGGATATGTVILPVQAPTNGLVVNLTSDNSAASVPSSITIPSGQSSGTFQLSAGSVSSNTTANINASCLSSSGGAAVTVTPFGLSSFVATPTSLTGGSNSSAIVCLNGSAPTGNATVSLTSSNPCVVVPATACVNAGTSATSFTISTCAVSSSTTATITATLGSTVLQTTVTVNPATISQFIVTPGAVTAGTSTAAVLRLGSKAGPNGDVVTITVSGPASAPATVTVPAGSTAVSFTIPTSAVSSQTTVTISAALGSSYQTTTFTVNPSALSNFFVTPTTVIGGANSAFVAQVSSKAPSGGDVISFQSSSSDVQITSTATIPAGSTGVSKTITTSAVTASETVTLTATLGSSSMQATLTLNPIVLSNFYLSPTTVNAGTNSAFVAQISGKAPSGGAVVSLQSSSPDVQVPATATVPAGSTGVSKTITTSAVTATETVTITATFGSSTKQATLTLNPIALSNFYLSPTTVNGGASSAFVAQIGCKAPSGGVVVSLQSSSPDVQVPATATIPGGVAGVSQKITTSTVTATEVVTITATLGSSSRQATLTLNPPVLSSFIVTPPTVNGGANSAFVARLNGAAPSGGAVVALQSSSLDVQVPACATIPAGSSAVSQAITSSPVSATENVTTTTTLGSTSISATLTLVPASISNFYTLPATVEGGQNTAQVVQLTGKAGLSGNVITLASADPHVIVPAGVTVPTGGTGVSYVVQTLPVTTNTSVVITATEGASSATTTINLSP